MREIDTDDGVQTKSPYSQGIVHEGTVFVSGQVGLDPDTLDVVGDDVGTQAAQAIENAAAVLEASGSSLDDVLKTTVFLTDPSDFGAFNDVYEEYFSAPYPARSAVITKLANDDLVVEIEMVGAVQ